MIQVSILRRDFPGNGQRILPQDSTPPRNQLFCTPPTPPFPTRSVCFSLSAACDSFSPPHLEIAIGRFNLECRSLHSLESRGWHSTKLDSEERKRKHACRCPPRYPLPPPISASDSAPTSHSESLPPAGRRKIHSLPLLANLSDGIRSCLPFETRKSFETSKQSRATPPCDLLA